MMRPKRRTDFSGRLSGFRFDADGDVGKPGRSNFLERAVHPLDGFVNLRLARKTDDDGVNFLAGHRETDGFLAVLRVDELAVADDFCRGEGGGPGGWCGF